MFAIYSVLVLLLMFFYVCDCQRRIKNGQDLNVDRRYVVYLVKAPLSDVGYDSWLCGGAIVASQFVITSAACVNDVDFLYVIAGYKKYVPDSDIEKDKCTSKMKKKVIYTCSPKGYNLKYGELDYWSFIDIALVKVESEFAFDDSTYETLCSYKPTTIPINFEEKYQEAGTDALVLGWGHKKNWRKPKDNSNYNQPTLKYAPTLLLAQDACIEHYEDYANMTNVIKTYMVCSLGKGNIDDEGNPIQQSLPLLNGCTSPQQKLLGFEGVSCEQGSSEDSSDEDDTRRYDRRSNQTGNVTLNDFKTKRARRSGICQNDHGGPLITWAGATEVLIGIASVFKVSEEYECMGPYLYTSTRCTGLFLDCVLRSELPARRDGRRYLCDRPPSERGYATIERTISWKDHPAGSAENENIERSGPKPKISPGLKRLTNNNNQPPNVENENGDSNNKFQSYKNPPIVSNAPKEVQERASKSRYQDEPKYESNKMYSTNNHQPPIVENESDGSNNKFQSYKNPPVVSNAPKEVQKRAPKSYQEEPKYKSNEMYSTNNNQPPIVENESDGSNNKFQAYKNPPIVSNAPKEVHEWSPETRYQKESKYELNKMYSTNNNPVVVRNEPKEHKIILGEERLPVNERQQEGTQYESNNQYSAIASNAHNGRFKIIDRIPRIKIPTGMAVRSVRPLRN